MSVREFDDGADDWMEHGACRAPGVDPDLFFSQQHAHIDAAKQVCAGCDVSASCLEYATVNREVGVWGGSDDADRRKARNMARPGPRVCKNGHPMTPDNVHYRADGGRRCLACWRVYYKVRRDAEKTGLTLLRGGQT